METKNWYVYILFNEQISRYYVGCCSDIRKRLVEHRKPDHKTKYTRKQKGHWHLVYSEMLDSRSEALRRERQIKRQKSRAYIEKLIARSK